MAIQTFLWISKNIVLFSSHILLKMQSVPHKQTRRGRKIIFNYVHPLNHSAAFDCKLFVLFKFEIKHFSVCMCLNNKLIKNTYFKIENREYPNSTVIICSTTCMCGHSFVINFFENIRKLFYCAF